MPKRLQQSMQDMLIVKRKIKHIDNKDIKDCIALTKLVYDLLKSKGSVKNVIEYIINISDVELKHKIYEINKDICYKRKNKNISN